MSDLVIHLTESRIHELRDMTDLQFNDALKGIKADPIQSNFQSDPVPLAQKYEYRK